MTPRGDGLNTGVQLSGYGLVLAVVFAAAWTTGDAVGPLGASDPTSGPEHNATQRDGSVQPDRGDAGATTTGPAPPLASPTFQPALPVTPGDPAPVAGPAAPALIPHPEPAEGPAPAAVLPASVGQGERPRRVVPAAGPREPRALRIETDEGVRGSSRHHCSDSDHRQPRGQAHR